MQIEILKQLLAAMTSLVMLLQGMIASPGMLKLTHKRIVPNVFGAATVTTGFNYPTSSYSFSDGDTINAGDFNNILTWIGTRNSTDTNSVSYNAFTPPLNTATNTLGVAHGGTGATSLTANNVILGNGTSSPQFVAPGASGNVLTSNGTTWTATTTQQFSVTSTFSATANFNSSTNFNATTTFSSGPVGAISFNAVSSTQVYYQSTTSNIETVDLSSYVGAHRSFAILRVYNSSTVTSNYGCFSSDDTDIVAGDFNATLGPNLLDLTTGLIGYLYCETGSDGKIQFRGTGSNRTQMWLYSYIR